MICMFVFQSSLIYKTNNYESSYFSPEKYFKNSKIQLEDFYLLGHAIDNFYNNAAISEKIHEVFPSSSNIKNKLYRPTGDKIKTDLKNESEKFVPSTVSLKDIAESADGVQDVGYTTKPILAAYREVLSKFVRTKSGESQLDEMVDTPIALILTFFSNSLEGRVIDKERLNFLLYGDNETLKPKTQDDFLVYAKEGRLGLWGSLEIYFNSFKGGKGGDLDANLVFENVISPFLKSNGFSDESIASIKIGFFNQPKEIDKILVSATLDAVPKSDLSADAKILAYEKLCIQENIRLLNDLYPYIKNLFWKNDPSASSRIAPYMWYGITRKDLENSDALEKQIGEIEKHLSFFKDAFIDRVQDNPNSRYNQKVLNFYKQSYETALNWAYERGMSKEEFEASLNERYAELVAIQQGFESDNLQTKIQAWRDFNKFKARYALAKYNHDTDPQYSQKDLLEPSDAPSYLAMTYALNVIGRNVGLVPSQGKNLMTLEFSIYDNESKSTIFPASEDGKTRKGVAVVSESNWHVVVNEQTTLVVPDPDIIQARGMDYLANVNSGNENIEFSHKFGLDKNGFVDYNHHIFTLREETHYDTLEDAKKHHTAFYVPGSMREDEQNLTRVEIYDVGLDVSVGSSSKKQEETPSYSNIGVSFGLSDYENIHDKKKEKSITEMYSTAISREEQRGERRAAKEGIDYLNEKLNLGIGTEEGLWAETWGQSKMPRWSSYLWNEKIDGLDLSGMSSEDIQKFFLDNVNDVLNKTVQQTQEPSMRENEDFKQFIDKEGNAPQVYSSLENVEKYAGSLSRHRYENDLYLTYLTNVYSRMPDGPEKEKLYHYDAQTKTHSGLIFDAYVDNIGFYAQKFVRNQSGLVSIHGKAARILEYVTKSMLESGPSINFETTWLGIPFTDAGFDSKGTLYGTLAYVMPFGNLNRNTWERESSFAPQVRLPGFAGSFINFQNLEGFAAQLGWRTLLWESDTKKTSVKGAIEIGVFLVFPRKEETELIQSLLDSADRLISLWGQFDHKNENTIPKSAIRKELGNLKNFFGESGPKPDSRATDLIGKIEYALNNPQDDTIDRTDLENQIMALARNDAIAPGHIYTYYSGEELGVSFMSYGTFINYLGMYQGVENVPASVNSAIPGGYAKVVFEFDSEINGQMPYNIKMEIHPLVPYLAESLATNMISNRQIFAGSGGTGFSTRNVWESALKNNSYLKLKLPPTFVETNIEYIYPFTSNLFAKLGNATTFNLFAFDMEKSDFYVDVAAGDYASLRLKHGFEKALLYSKYFPNLSASLQVDVDNAVHHFTGLNVPVDMSFQAFWERDLPSYDFSKPHLESLGYNFKISTSTDKIFGKSLSKADAERREESEKSKSTYDSNPAGWRAPSMTYTRLLAETEGGKKNLSLLKMITPDERIDLESRRLLVSEKYHTYKHPQTGAAVGLEEMVSYYQKERWYAGLEKLLSPKELEDLEKRRSAITAERMYYTAGGQLQAFEDAVFEILDKKALAYKTEQFGIFAKENGLLGAGEGGGF